MGVWKQAHNHKVDNWTELRSCLVLSTQVFCYQEVLVLLWKLLEENPVFMQYVLKNCDINEVLVQSLCRGCSLFCSLEDEDDEISCPCGNPFSTISISRTSTAWC